MIYICIPAHDEGQTVGVVLWKVRQVMGEASRDYQILVADDGSKDKTPAVLEPYTRVLPLTVMRSEQRRGYAASLEMLLREAVHRSEYPRRDAIVVLQADFTEEPDHIGVLLKRVESGADIVVSNPAEPARPTFKRRVGRLLGRWLMRRVDWPEGVTDPFAGFHAYRVSAVRRAFEDGDGRLLRYEGRAANAALLRAAAPHARRVDVVDFSPRPERHQRESRFDLGSYLRAAWAFARNHDVPGLLPVAGLAPAAVLTARAADHVVTAESLRKAGTSRPGEAGPPAGRRRTARSRNGKGRAGVMDGRRKRGEGESRRAGRDRDDGEGRARKKRRRTKAEPEETAAQGSSGPEDRAADPGEQTPAPRKRRSRRGRRKRTSPKPAQAGAEVVEPAESAADTGSDAGGEPGERKKRRRGRRGGRRRRKGSQADGPPRADGTGEAATDSQ